MGKKESGRKNGGRIPIKKVGVKTSGGKKKWGKKMGKDKNILCEQTERKIKRIPYFHMCGQN